MKSIIVTVVIVSIVGENAALGVGKYFGVRPFAPLLSVNKTMEGCAAQLLGCGLSAVALGVVRGGEFLPAGLQTESLSALFSYGLALGVFSVIGDLYQSFVKRIGGVKNMGGYLPAVGSVSDRVDGLTFAWCVTFTWLSYSQTQKGN
jgi:phosphatidate cytidylyltransferase